MDLNRSATAKRRYRLVFIIVIFCVAIGPLLFDLAGRGQPDRIDSAILESPEPTDAEFAAIKEKADKDDAESQLYMGIFCANGNHVAQDYAEAAKWYLKAAEQGNPTAMRNLGVLYDCGLGVERNYAEAVKWYKLAGRKCEPAAFMGLARFAMSYDESVLPMSAGSYNLFRMLALYFVAPEMEQQYQVVDETFWKIYCMSKRFFQEDEKIIERLKIEMYKPPGDDYDKLYLRMAIFEFQGQGGRVRLKEYKRNLELSARKNLAALFLLKQYYETPNPVYDSLNDWNGGNTHSFKQPIREYQALMRVIPDPTFRFLFCTEFGCGPDICKALVKDGYLPAAQYLYDFGGIRVGDISDKEWFEFVNACADKGDISSQVILAHLLIKGIGCEQDLEKSLKLTRSIHGNPDARGMYALAALASGRMRLNSSISLPMPGNAVAFFTEKADAGDSDAQIYLGLYYAYEKKYSVALDYVKRAVLADRPEAMLVLLDLAKILRSQMRKAQWKKESQGASYSANAEEVALSSMIFSGIPDCETIGSADYTKCERVLQAKAISLNYYPMILHEFDDRYISQNEKESARKEKLLRILIENDVFNVVATVNSSLEYSLISNSFDRMRWSSKQEKNVLHRDSFEREVNFEQSIYLRRSFFSPFCEKGRLEFFDNIPKLE